MMTISKVLLPLLLATAGVVSATSYAAAVEAQAKSTVNVRTGPGTSFSIVGQLSTGEVVDIKECAPSNFCFVERDGTDGWVSSTYLVPVEDEAPEPPSGGGGSSNPDCSFGFSVGPGGPSLSVNCGDAPPPPPPPPPPAPEPDEDEPGACFYTGNAFSGQQFCMGLGTRNALNPTFNNKISSVELFGGAKVRLCDNPGLGGTCKVIGTDTAPLLPAINDKASSLKVYVGPGLPPLPPPPPPVLPVPPTFSTGPIDLAQTFTANLDNGAVGGPGTDIWYQAVTAVEKYLTPKSGAQLALGDGSNRGFAGCSAASFSSDPVPLFALSPGTYVCAKTNQGRISQFRVNGFVGTTMKLGYATWAN